MKATTSESLLGLSILPRPCCDPDSRLAGEACFPSDTVEALLGELESALAILSAWLDNNGVEGLLDLFHTRTPLELSETARSDFGATLS